MNSPPAHPLHGWRSWLPRVLAESVLIVFSVLLALGVDEWREDRELARQVQEARAAFATEIRGNLELLKSEQFHGHHKRMWAHYRLQSEAGDAGDQARLDELHAIEVKEFGNGVWPTPLRDAVWRSLSQSDLIRHMNSAEVFTLVDIYREQEEIDRMHNRMFEAWLQPTAAGIDPEFRRSRIQSTRMYLADVVAAEQRLLARYGEILPKLEQPSKG